MDRRSGRWILLRHAREGGGVDRPPGSVRVTWVTPTCRRGRVASHTPQGSVHQEWPSQTDVFCISPIIACLFYVIAFHCTRS